MFRDWKGQRDIRWNMCFVVAMIGAWSSLGCERKAIPPRIPLPPLEAPNDTSSPANKESLLEGGEEVFSENFERQQLGQNWKASTETWTIVAGELHNSDAENKGIWLTKPLPERVRVEFDIRSAPLPGQKKFPGDLKCEIFAASPAHEGGYILINGGWFNKNDVIARLDEHGKDAKIQPTTMKVEPNQSYHWSVVRTDEILYWFRDQELLMTYEDPEPLKGHFFGFNNWKSNVFIDNIRVFELQ
jgi:hypothetical protein